MSTVPQFSADHWQQVGHYYTPIEYYKGEVLKYAGIATKGNSWVLEERPGTIVLSEYKGDRIKKADHSLHKGF